MLLQQIPEAANLEGEVSYWVSLREGFGAFVGPDALSWGETAEHGSKVGWRMLLLLWLLESRDGKGPPWWPDLLLLGYLLSSQPVNTERQPWGLCFDRH